MATPDWERMARWMVTYCSGVASLSRGRYESTEWTASTDPEGPNARAGLVRAVLNGIRGVPDAASQNWIVVSELILGSRQAARYFPSGLYWTEVAGQTRSRECTRRPV